ncbi:hypothetical protein R3P38DRAFT_2805898 [Favolaschia claudopus]|uniref:Uncharacterized protein n=1 Tax=Favolaschia claudopus TaxID=2862362 RepID=A0AAV9ZLV7_9AGAR
MVWRSHCRPLYRGVVATPVLENDERNGVACILKIRVKSNDDFSSSLTNGFPELVFNLYLIGNSRRLQTTPRSRTASAKVFLQSPPSRRPRDGPTAPPLLLSLE